MLLLLTLGKECFLKGEQQSSTVKNKQAEGLPAGLGRMKPGMK